MCSVDPIVRRIVVTAFFTVAISGIARPAAAQCFYLGIFSAFLHGEIPMNADGRNSFDTSIGVQNNDPQPCLFQIVSSGSSGFITSLSTTSSSYFHGGDEQVHPDGTGTVPFGQARGLRVQPRGTANDSCRDRLARIHLHLNGERQNTSVLVRQGVMVGPPAPGKWFGWACWPIRVTNPPPGPPNPCNGPNRPSYCSSIDGNGVRG